MEPSHKQKVAQVVLRFQATATVAWFLLVVPSVLWWRNSVAWVVVMSVWANVASHGTGWISAWINSDNQKADGD